MFVHIWMEPGEEQDVWGPEGERGFTYRQLEKALGCGDREARKQRMKPGEGAGRVHVLKAGEELGCC